MIRAARAATGLVALPVVLVGVAAGAPAHAAPGRCAAGAGVTVVVDYGPLGGGVDLGCDGSGAGDPASQVMPRAGFPLTYVSGEPFVCRIGGLPNAQDEQCVSTPPEEAYWALFWSDGRNDRWVYATTGVTSLDVPDGGSIGWRFQDGGGRELPGAAPTSAAPEPEPSREPGASKEPRASQEPKPSKEPTSTPRPSEAPQAPRQPLESSAPATASAVAPSAVGGDAGRIRAKTERRPAAHERSGTDTDRRGDHGADHQADRPPRSAAATDDETVTAGGVAEQETPLAPVAASGRGDEALTWVAGGAALLLAAAAAILARRRRG